MSKPKKTIDTLTQDIYKVLDRNEHHEFTGDPAKVGSQFYGTIENATKERSGPRELGSLWASDLGKPCLRQLWYSFHRPELGEPLPQATSFKFLYGSILEDLVLCLAKEAGHEVTHEQERVEYQVNDKWKVSGKIDAVIDGILLDVKSTTPYGYKKYTGEGLSAKNDTFGYRYQLAFYETFGPVRSPETGFLWIDKQLGKLKYKRLDDTVSKEDLERQIQRTIETLDNPDLPDRPSDFDAQVAVQASNRKVPTPCSYCAFKRECWNEPESNFKLRTFLYSTGPVDFVTIEKEPRVPELHYRET